MAEAILEVDRLSAAYAASEVLGDVSFELDPGSLATLIGPNGAGKTTTLRCLMGLHGTVAGDIRFGGSVVTDLGTGDRAAHGLNLVPEGRQLFSGLTVRENLRLGATARGRDVASNLERVLGLFPEVVSLLDRPAGNLSGGEQQMCAIGRGLMTEPRLLMIDELSLGLAPAVVDRLATALVDLHGAFDVTVLFVEQDVDLALSIADRAIVLAGGRVAMDGAASDIGARREQLEAAFLGTDEFKS